MDNMDTVHREARMSRVQARAGAIVSVGAASDVFRKLAPKKEEKRPKNAEEKALLTSKRAALPQSVPSARFGGRKSTSMLCKYLKKITSAEEERSSFD